MRKTNSDLENLDKKLKTLARKLHDENTALQKLISKLNQSAMEAEKGDNIQLHENKPQKKK